MSSEKIRALNDEFRRTFVGGRLLVTQGIFHRDDLPAILEEVRTFDAFDEGNDPYGEHDMGGFKIGDHQVLFKLDYYDLDLNGGSPDPADPAVTCRVMTVMLAEEY